MVSKEKQATGNELKAIIRAFFKGHGVKSPTKYLASRAGISTSQIYWLYNAVEKGIGIKDGQMDPKYAIFFIFQSEELITPDEVMLPNPVDEYLRPKLRKFYQEQKRKDGRKTNCPKRTSR